MIAYRVGYPFWKMAGRLGLPLKIFVDIFYDPQTGTFTAYSDDFAPEASIEAQAMHWEGLVKDIDSEIEEALTYVFKHRLPKLHIHPHLVYAYPFEVGS